MGRRWGKGQGGCREDAAFGVGLCGVEPEDEAEVPIGEQGLEPTPFHYSEATATMLPSFVRVFSAPPTAKRFCVLL